MRILVTGSSGQLGDALIRVLGSQGHEMVGLDLQPSASTTFVGSVTDRVRVRQAMYGVEAVLHTATLNGSVENFHPQQAFVDTNVLGTLVLLEEAVAAGVGRFVFTSTADVFGEVMRPPPGAPAAWLTDGVRPVPRDIHGISTVAAENICELTSFRQELPCVILRIARHLPAEDQHHAGYLPANVQANEMLYCRVDIEDVVEAHRCALERAPGLGFGRYLISATTPFDRADRADLHRDAVAVVTRHFPEYREIYRAQEWRMFPRIPQVSVNRRARIDLGWRPRHDFAEVLRCLAAGTDSRSELSLSVGRVDHRQEHPGLYLVR